MIQIKNIYKKLDNKSVFSGVTLNIHKGETLVVIGQSGCGKSVLLKHIIGLMKPDSGDVTVKGIDIVNSKRNVIEHLRKKIGMVFQGSALFDSLTVAENVFFALDQHTKMSVKEKYEIAEERLARVGLYDVMHKAPSDLSGGMKKRVAIARAIASQPEIILYDEPTTGLDPITANEIDSLIKELHQSINVTSIVVTHDMKSAYTVADRIAMIHDGKVIDEGLPEEIKKSQFEIVRRFVK